MKMKSWLDCNVVIAAAALNSYFSHLKWSRYISAILLFNTKSFQLVYYVCECTSTLGRPVVSITIVVVFSSFKLNVEGNDAVTKIGYFSSIECAHDVWYEYNLQVKRQWDRLHYEEHVYGPKKPVAETSQLMKDREKLEMKWKNCMRLWKTEQKMQLEICN